ncbi:hypothetical protein LXL04_008066 [Taraxacum kok-saghyz]
MRGSQLYTALFFPSLEMFNLWKDKLTERKLLHKFLHSSVNSTRKVEHSDGVVTSEFSIPYTYSVFKTSGSLRIVLFDLDLSISTEEDDSDIFTSKRGRYSNLMN